MAKPDSAKINEQIAADRKIHIAFLDSLRGLAALYVVAYHVTGDDNLARPAAANRWLKLVIQVCGHGHVAVNLFIVLSGFCLMIPVARAGGRLKSGTLEFLKRRARRIVPPYYCCLLLTALTTFITAQVAIERGHPCTVYTTTFYLGYAATHLLLIQNLFRAYNYSLNGALWTLATEWQIYFVFAFCLLPLFRKYGALATIVIGSLIGVSTYGISEIREACLWYIGLFAMGIAAADAGFSASPKLKVSDKTVIVLMVVFGLLSFVPRNHYSSGAEVLNPMVDFLSGASLACLLLYLVRIAPGETGSVRLRLRALLSARPLVALGIFSYSLYMIHPLCLMLIGDLLDNFHLQNTTKGMALELAMIPVIVAVSYAFHLVCERPFMTVKPAATPDIPALPPADQTAVAKP